MQDPRIAVVGIGAIGSVMAAALLTRYPQTLLVGQKPDWGKELRSKGIRVSGAVNYRAPVQHYASELAALADFGPTLVFLCTKTFHLAQLLPELKSTLAANARVVATQNGLGPEDVVADALGVDAAFRMSLNCGAALKGPGEVEATFFNKPNYLGGLTKENRPTGSQIAGMLTDCGFDTEYVDDIKWQVWKKMVLKCTMAPICAVADKTIKEALDFPPTREIADACFQEALAVAKAVGYDLGEDYLQQAMGYLEKVGGHKDSMCFDVTSKRPTEIDFLGGKIIEYGRAKGIPTPFYTVMTNLIKAIESSY